MEFLIYAIVFVAGVAAYHLYLKYKGEKKAPAVAEKPKRAYKRKAPVKPKTPPTVEGVPSEVPPPTPPAQ